MSQFCMTLVFSLVFFISQFSGAAESLKDQHIEIGFLAPQSFAQNSETLIGLHFKMDQHWHVYWKNPGDSGAAPKFQIIAKNASAGPILWPAPERLPVAHLTNLGYDDEAVYFFNIKTGSEPSLQIDADLEWLVCQEECTPGFGKLTLSRPIQGAESRFEKSTEEKLKTFEKRLPQDITKSNFQVVVSETSDGLIKAVVTSKTALPNKMDLFPIDPEFIQPGQPKISRTESSYEVFFQKSATAARLSQVGFLLVADENVYEYLNLKLEPPTLTTESASFAALIVLLASALLGGVLLNLMPCVFPVISIKAVSLLKTENANERKRDGLLYTFGVLTTFAGLGAGFLILRQLGSAVGWGFQLQSPVVVLSLAILFWLMALNFLGVFEMGTSIMNTTGNMRWHSSFGTGILSVFVAAPCTGPFMGTALGATATMPGYQAMLVFLSLGLGLALPYLILTLSPQLAKKMPKPGAWMETLKEFFAFPLFATVLWLLWVLGIQTGSQGWVASGTALLGISFAIWLGKKRKKFWKPIAWVIAIAIIAHSVQDVRTVGATETETASESKWQPYSEQAVNAALEKGQPVFIDFTAAWCITCQVNKKAVLETASADQIFEKSNILRLKADWTKQDPLITKALAKFGRNSVPVYAFYSKKGAQVQILPQILTIDMIKNLIPLKEE